MGANAGRLAQTARDAFRALSQVRGSPADSVRPVQTGRSWLGAKGSRVQIPPSRLLKQVFGFNFREPIGEPMAVPEQGQVSSVAFAFRVRFTAVALSVRAGRIS